MNIENASLLGPATFHSSSAQLKALSSAKCFPEKAMLDYQAARAQGMVLEK